MNIQLIEKEICEALVLYLNHKGFQANINHVDITLTAGRTQGHTASIDILPQETPKPKQASAEDDEEFPFPEAES